MPELQAALKSKPSTISAHNHVNFRKQFPERVRDTRVGANQKYNMAKKDPHKFKSGNKAEQVNSIVRNQVEIGVFSNNTLQCTVMRL